MSQKRVKKEHILLLIGPSGSGKGTQIEFLKKRVKNARVIYPGQILRDLVSRPTLTAKFLRPYLQKGLLVPGWLASFTWMKVLFQELIEGESIIFDGTPRQVSEAKLLDEVIGWYKKPLPKAIFIDIGPEVAWRRLLERGRFDDTELAIKERLKFFRKNVLPVVKYYEKRKRLIRVNGEQSEKKVDEDIRNILGI